MGDSHVVEKSKSQRRAHLETTSCPQNVVPKPFIMAAKRVCYHLKALKDAPAVFWDSTLLFWETILKTLHLLMAIS